MNTPPCLTTDIDTWVCRYTEDDGYFMESEHIHHHHELSFNFSHIKIKHTLNGKVFYTDSPFIAYRAPYTLHSSTTVTNEKYIRYRLDINPCMFTLFDGIISLDNLKTVNGCIIPMTDEGMCKFLPFLQRLDAIFHVKWEGPIERISAGLLTVLLGEVSQNKEYKEEFIISDKSRLRYIQDILYYIVDHISEELTLSDIAKAFFISESKLQKDFRTETSLSVHVYITAVRISLAKSWLKDSIPLSDIATKCGFSQTSTFIVMFKRMTGMTPEAYRKQLQQSSFTPIMSKL